MANEQATGGIGFGGVLAIVFIVLKLLGKITWSWLWVLSPIWIPLAIFFAFLVFAGVFMGLIRLFLKGTR